MLGIKIAGAFLTVTAFSLFGVRKSAELKEKYLSSEKIISGIDELARKIKLGEDELPVLIKEAFDEAEISHGNKELYAFFENLGMADVGTVLNKCKVYRGKFFEKRNEQKAEYQKYARLYRVGFTLLGVLIVILIF